MTKQEAIKILERDCPKRPQKLWSVKRTEAIHMAIEALKVRTDGDTISRRDAISAIKKDIMGGLNYESILEELPSAQPCKIHITGTRKFVSNIDLDEPELEKGEWIWSPVADDGTVSGCCNKCSFSHVFIGGHTTQYSYCPNCGADMRCEASQ